MAIYLKFTCILQLKKPQISISFLPSRKVSTVSYRKFNAMACFSAVCTVGISEKFAQLKKEGKEDRLMHPMVHNIGGIATWKRLVNKCTASTPQLNVPCASGKMYYG